ncbi:MAG: amidohydrolase family protein [Rhizomicrobium sp.]
MDIIRGTPRYLLDELLADLKSGHNVRGTIYMECGAMYRADGPAELKCVGETEFVKASPRCPRAASMARCAPAPGSSAMSTCASASRRTTCCAATSQPAMGRFRGIRHSASYDEDPGVLGPLSGRNTAGLYLDAKFREGFACLEPLGLSFDAWLLEPQLPELIDLARTFPGTTIVLDHVGTPLGIGRYEGKREARFAEWKQNIRTLSKCENVNVKVGGLPMPFAGWKKRMHEADPPSETLGGAVEALYRDLHRGVRRRPAACSKATFPSTASAAITPACGTRSSASPRTIPPTTRAPCSAAPRSGCIGWR